MNTHSLNTHSMNLEINKNIIFGSKSPKLTDYQATFTLQVSALYGWALINLSNHYAECNELWKVSTNGIRPACLFDLFSTWISIASSKLSMCFAFLFNKGAFTMNVFMRAEMLVSSITVTLFYIFFCFVHFICFLCLIQLKYLKFY